MEVRRKREAYTVICGLIDSLISHENILKDYLIPDHKKRLYFKNLELINKNDFKEECNKVDFNKIDEDYGAPIHALIIDLGVKKILYFTNQIFLYMPFLESELLKILIRIKNCTFTRSIVLLPIKENVGVGEYSENILTYFRLLQKLENFNDKLKKKYLNGYEKRY